MRFQKPYKSGRIERKETVNEKPEGRLQRENKEVEREVFLSFVIRQFLHLPAKKNHSNIYTTCYYFWCGLCILRRVGAWGKVCD